jgi:hypothetical protein
MLLFDWTIYGYSGSACRRNWSARDGVAWLLSYNNLLVILHSKIVISWTRTMAAADGKECFQGDDSASTYSQRAQWRHVSRALSKSKPMQYQDVRIISHMLHSGHKIHAVAVELAVTLGHSCHTHTCKKQWALSGSIFPFAIIINSSSRTFDTSTLLKTEDVYHTIHRTFEPSRQTRPKSRRHLFHRKVQGLRGARLCSRQAGPLSETRQAEDRIPRTVCSSPPPL